MTWHSVPIIHQDPSLLISKASDVTEPNLLSIHVILVGNPVEMFFFFHLSLGLCLRAVLSPRSGGSSSGLDGLQPRPAGWCRVWMLSQCLWGSFSGILQLPPTLQGHLTLDEGREADLQWKCRMFFRGNDSTSSSEDNGVGGLKQVWVRFTVRGADLYPVDFTDWSIMISLIPFWRKLETE